MLRSCSSVTSAAYAKTTENVTANTPLIDIVAKNHHVFMLINGIGRQVINTVINKKNFRPQISDNAPINGADRNERKPFIPMMIPFIKNVWSGNVSFKTYKKIYVLDEIKECVGMYVITSSPTGINTQITLIRHMLVETTYRNNGHREKSPREIFKEYNHEGMVNARTAYSRSLKPK